jgi:hypothetical protein
VQQYAVGFIVYARVRTASELSQLINCEFDASLECDIPAHGFLRERWGECGHDNAGLQLQAPEVLH